MPAKAENISAFDLKLLKALLNFKINRSHLKEVTMEQKRMLCKSYHENGTVGIRHEYLLKIWPKEKEISHNISYYALDQLCSILRTNYRWHFFSDDVLLLRPESIQEDVPYSKLSTVQREKINSAIEKIFEKYRKFEDFERAVIEKVTAVEAGEIVRPHGWIDEAKKEREFQAFASKLYIELTTRKAALPIDENNDVIEEIYNSWYKLFCLIRDELGKMPVMYLADIQKPGSVLELAVKILNEILRPHLTEHQAKFRNWLEKEKRNPKFKNLSPQELQRKYPNYSALINSMKKKNSIIIETARELYFLLNQTA